MVVIVGTLARITYIAETTRGLTPTSPTMKTLRTTGRNINLKRDTLESAEVSVSRQRADVRLGFGRVEGALNFELGLGSYTDWLAYLMARPNDSSGAVTPSDNTAPTTANYNGWFMPAKRDTVSIQAVTAATSTAPGLITFRVLNAAANTNWQDLGYRPGDWVVSSGFTDADNNSGGSSGAGQGAPAEWRVMSISNSASISDLVCQIPAGFLGQTTEASGAGKTIEYAGRKLSIGTTLTTMTIERGFVDGINPVFQVFPGCGIVSMSLSVSPDAIVGGTWNILGGLAGDGLSAVDIDQTASIDLVADAAATNSPFAAFDGSVSTVTAAGAHLGAIVTQCDFTLDNQRTLQAVVGRKFSQDLYEGVAKVTGTVTLLLDSRDHLTAFQDEASLSTMVIRLNELGTSEFISFVFNRVKYLTADIDPPQNGPVLIQCSFEALEQAFPATAPATTAPSTNEAFRIQRSTTGAA